MDVMKNCFICKKTLSVGALKTFKSKGIQSLSVYSRKYDDGNWKLLQNKNEIVVHQQCNLNYSTGANKIPEVADSPASGRSSRSSSIERFDFHSLCIFCHKNWTKSSSTKYVISDDLIKEKLVDIAQKRNDDLGMSVISLIDAVPSLVEARARYHKYCFDKFKYIPRESASTPDPLVAETMQKIYNYIEYQNECQFTMKELKAVGNNALSDKTILKYLRIRYNEDITIVTRAPRDIVICYSGTATLPVDEYWHLHQESKKEDERLRIIKTAAELVRKQIKSRSYEHKLYPSSATFLDNVETDIPSYLNTFLSDIMLDRFVRKNQKETVGANESISIETLASDHPGEDRKSAEEFASYDNSENKMTVKKNYLAHSIISAVRPKSFVSTFHQATGLYINRKSGSKLIVNLLSNLGVCASYYDVALHEMSAIKAEVTTITPPVFAQYVYDNADHNAQTLDGKNTIHIAAGIVALHPPSALGTGNPVPKLAKLPRAAEVASFGNVPLENYVDHGTSLKSIVYEDVQQYKFGNTVAGLTPIYTTYMWGRYLKVWELPSARGFLEKISEDTHSNVSRVLLLPIIDEDPSNPQTIYTALHYAAKHAKEIAMKTCFVTLDYALWIKAKQIICNTPDEDLKAVQLRLGGFHLLMSYLKAVGTIMGGSGIKELFGTVFALNSVDKMLSCTSYSRAIRGHILAATAIGELIAEAASTDENINSHTAIEGIKTFDPRRAPSSVMSIQRIINAKSRKLTDLLKDFKENPPTSNIIVNDNDCKAMYHLFLSAVGTLKLKGPTAEVWIQYFHMIITASQFIDAERNGNWNLHLQCVREMLPVFHAAGHFNYIKGAQIYLQDMEKLKNSMDVDEYMAFTEKGLFTIRRTEKPWSGVWSDMTIEQTAMRFFGTGKEGTKHGRKMTESVVSRFILGMPYAFDVLDQLEQIADCRCSSSDQHVELTYSRQKKDKEDTQTFKDWLNEHGVFEHRPDKLISLSSGLVGDSTVDCHQAIEKGLQSMKKMIGSNADTFKHSKSNTVKTLISTTPVIEIENETVSVNTTLIFQKIAAGLIENKNLMKDAIEYELAPYPMALFNEQGIMRESQKSELYKSFKSTPYIQKDFADAKFVVDGGYLLHKVIWPKNSTFRQLFEIYETYVVKHYSRSATIVFDGYNPDNMGIKSYERYRRVYKKISPEINFTNDLKAPREKDFFLSNNKNKAKFIKDLIYFLEDRHQLTVFQAQEDADALIVQTAIDIARNTDKKVVIVGTDVDLVVLMIGLTPDNLIVNMLKPRISKQPDTIISSKDNKIFKDFILFSHAFSGCDTVSSVYMKGKKSLLKLLQTDLDTTKLMQTFYKQNSPQEEVKTAGEAMMLKLFGSKKKTLKESRVERFAGVARKSSAINLSLLPPTSGATYQHSLRAYLQVQIWLGNLLNPEDWGWKKTETMFLPVRTNEPLAPQELLTMVHCTCSVSNCSSRCGCKKAGLRCTRACKFCHGETCLNSADIAGGNNNEDDDQDLLEDQNTEGDVSTSEFIMKPGYLQIIRGIYSTDGDDEDDNVNDENLPADRPPDEDNEVPSTSTPDDPPSSKRRRRR